MRSQLAAVASDEGGRVVDVTGASAMRCMYSLTLPNYICGRLSAHDQKPRVFGRELLRGLPPSHERLRASENSAFLVLFVFYRFGC